MRTTCWSPAAPAYRPPHCCWEPIDEPLLSPPSPPSPPPCPLSPSPPPSLPHEPDQLPGVRHARKRAGASCRSGSCGAPYEPDQTRYDDSRHGVSYPQKLIRFVRGV